MKEAEDRLGLTPQAYVAEKVAPAWFLIEAKGRTPRTVIAQEVLEAVPSYAAIIEGTSEVEAFAEAWYRYRG